MFKVRCCPSSLKDLWGNWRKSIKKPLTSFWDLLLRAIKWNIWLERNAHIFTSTCASTIIIIIKNVHMILMWMNAAPDSKRAKLDEPMRKIKRILEFLTSRDAELGVPPKHTTSPSDVYLMGYFWWFPSVLGFHLFFFTFLIDSGYSCFLFLPFLVG